MFRLVPMMDHQIPDVRDPGERVGENDDHVLVMAQRVGQQHQRAREAQPPEQQRHDDLFLLFSGIPLHKEPRGENQIAQPADDFPEHFPRINFRSS